MTRGRLRERLDTEACACAAHRLVDTEGIIATPWQFPGCRRGETNETADAKSDQPLPPRPINGVQTTCKRRS